MLVRSLLGGVAQGPRAMKTEKKKKAKSKKDRRSKQRMLEQTEEEMKKNIRR